MMRRKPSKHAAYYELIEQLARPGCALCVLGARAASRYLETMSGELLVDPGVRGQLRAALGFCRPHAHELDATAPRLTVAILHEDWLQRAAQELESWSRPRRGRPPAGPCAACAARQQSETELTRVMAAFLDDAELVAAYEQSSGLCLPHTLDLCRQLPEPARQRVIARERERIERLRGELAEVIRKHDYRFRDEPWGEERSAPGRATNKIVGD